MKLYKYQGAGNDFLLADNRTGEISVTTGGITSLCDRHYGIGADGLMLLENSGRYDFRMTYFNSDGSGGMMCGNGGRCIVAFACDMGIRHFDFEAADGFHTAEILENEGNRKIVRLKMKNVSTVKQENEDSWFIDTGTRHHVRFVKNLESYDVLKNGREIRYREEYGPVGVNANFAETDPETGILHVRTYEKGVENETFACGTGITASAIAAYLMNPGAWTEGTGNVHVPVKALRDTLAVDFRPQERGFADVWLTGPAVKVAEIIL
ncbi:MAG: diaminopimelate epimerase [Bacteroidetes bacterium]|uniref:Diaminopimelate epimerase n=1 Tax=Candidatus Cryptobacteroides faecipullorum TaxID=2840764 RepID=A0A9D9I5V0_9BACT|nr:diaminopimelate epimerase [Candidatus Cryptobacteroides faecipullorum]